MFEREDVFDGGRLLLTAVRRYRPETFEGSRLRQLALFQHYGMPTRPLDVMTSPLVVLFFACSGDPGHVARLCLLGDAVRIVG